MLGKTTQITQIALANDFQRALNYGSRVVCTQPRRLAATRSAIRVAEELDIELGQQVGYRVRGDIKSTKGVTLLEYVTEGILLNELLSSKDVAKISTVILDEIHERSLNMDTLMLCLKQLIQRNGHLRLIVMSATLNADKFRKYFDDAAYLHIPGKSSIQGRHSLTI
jgi:pre-mRNA-splicing factor ATP-dependent RNA helicase DHX15/PRP43